MHGYSLTSSAIWRWKRRLTTYCSSNTQLVIYFYSKVRGAPLRLPNRKDIVGLKWLHILGSLWKALFAKSCQSPYGDKSPTKLLVAQDEDRWEDRAQCSASSSTNIYFQNIVQMATASEREGMGCGGGKKGLVKNTGLPVSLGGWWLFKRSPSLCTCTDHLYACLDIQWKCQTQTCSLWIYHR